jgi:hypothetical protein
MALLAQRLRVRPEVMRNMSNRQIASNAIRTARAITSSANFFGRAIAQDPFPPGHHPGPKVFAEPRTAHHLQSTAPPHAARWIEAEPGSKERSSE